MIKGPDDHPLRFGRGGERRIRHDLKYNLENPRNTILIVSWQAPETLGRRLADREKQVMTFNVIYPGLHTAVEI